MLPEFRTQRKQGHCQGSRAESQRGTKPESIKVLRDKSRTLQPIGLQELQDCLRGKRSQVLQDAFLSDTGLQGLAEDRAQSSPSLWKSTHLQGQPLHSHQRGTGCGAGEKGFCGFQLNRFLEGKWNTGNSNRLGIHVLQTTEYNALRVIGRPNQFLIPTSKSLPSL